MMKHTAKYDDPDMAFSFDLQTGMVCRIWA